jgi:hypothetical protein
MADGKSLSIGVKRLADKLNKLSSAAKGEVQKVVVETTLEAQAFIVDKITNHIEPHSGESRKRNPQAVVTDLVDSGAYRASWTVSYPSAYSGKLSTNSPYALILEYGNDDRHAFFVARRTAIKMAPIFHKRMKAIIDGALR